MTENTSNLKDVYSRVTNKIIADLEKGELTWRKPWSSEHLASNVVRPLRFNDEPYSGINVLMLWACAVENGYASPYWMTFRQAQEMKAHVRKGEKASQVVYADKMIITEKNSSGEEESRNVPFLKSYSVFNASQIEGLPEDFYKVPEVKILNSEKRIEMLEEFFRNTKADIFTGFKAAYSQATDRIEMPPFESFIDASNYYATLSHEVAHWTKHPTRLNRDFNRKKWGDEGYAKEELVAELAACFLAADLGFEPVTRDEHAAYIQSWLKVLKNDSRYVFQAASHAQKAVEYVTNLQTREYSQFQLKRGI
ncbi:MAG: DUF1738 domain-containing protein [Bacteroidetes bacterium]|nr:MAG: DUF1738 domain-containing protein [Bacteroidota bacterium]REK05193.1 MAG: DUF1738 domain-containing protein [Bacteroidota bacterium]REK32598.1 MAG: DUF1738 domain-containing protein [Bacteroidota bacterium]REK48955.1 MAG: DUF1738 domain-containing protein [Bacteroidota bacterium]